MEGLWPPAPGEPSHRVVVSMDGWHSAVGLWPAEDPGGEDPRGYREWAYAEKGYYLEGDAGCCGTLRAVCVPSAGVVMVRHDGKAMAEWSPQPPVRTWEFVLSEAGYRAMVAHLEAEREGEAPIDDSRGFLWYDAARSYHAFHHCHHFTARALRAAGLPVFRTWAQWRWSLAAQLDRAAEMATAEARE